jgi:L-alanine-DL-glutamate epimerase-like enolase superfamily enzyme
LQITNVEVAPVELSLRLPYRTAYQSEIDRVTVVFVRVETRQGQVAWGCAAFDPTLTGETLTDVVRACRACADRARDLNPLNTEYALRPCARSTWPFTTCWPWLLDCRSIACWAATGTASRRP